MVVPSSGQTPAPIITTNQSVSEWARVLSDATTTTALLDRFTHRSHILENSNDSYRFKPSFENSEKETKGNTSIVASMHNRTYHPGGSDLSENASSVHNDNQQPRPFGGGGSMMVALEYPS